MDRGFFRHWGFDLDEADFAQALAALGTSSLTPTPDVPAAGQEPLAFRAAQLSEFIHEFYSRLDPSASAKAYRDAWNANASRGARIEIQPPPPGPYSREFDPQWLVEQLSHPNVGARSVYVRQDEPALPVSWQWPLRIGLLPDARSGELRTSLGRNAPSRLVEFIDISLTDTDCELLLLPYNLRTALQKVLALRTRISADCVLVLGGIAGDPGRAQSLLTVLRTDTRSSGVAVLSLPKEKRGTAGKESWLESLITFLAHNEPLDVALFDATKAFAGKELRLNRPYLVAANRLVTIARVEVTAARLADAISSLPTTEPISLAPNITARLRLPAMAPPQEIAAELINNLPRYDWKHESGDATSLVRLQERVAEHVGAPVRLGRAMAKPPVRMTLAAAPRLGTPPTSKSTAPETRHLQAQIRDQKDRVVASSLAPSSSYEAQVKIAELESGWIPMPAAFPTDQLPPTRDGHTLTVVFCELRSSAEVTPAAPQMSELHLPPTGPSSVCHFFFRTRKGQTEFRARVLVLFEGRVLQTGILRRSVGEGPSAEPAPPLQPETTVRASFEGLTATRAFDAAIVINDDPNGTPGATIISSHAAQFFEPIGLQDSLDAFRKILTTLTDLTDPPSKLDDDGMTNVLRQLANHGRLIWRMFSAQSGALAMAPRIQIVEAVPGAFLPVEFFYDGVAPLSSALLCTGASKELDSATSPGGCANRDNNQITCPTDFWGFSRVVERQSHRTLDRGVYELSEPSPQRPKLDVLARAVIATSAKVKANDTDKLLSIATTLCGSVVQAKDFDDLAKQVAATSPSLMILLPHSLDDPNVPNMAALELGDQILNSAQLDRPYVLGPQSKTGPVVLLLGCSTELTSLPYQKFVESFKAAGASIVLATMSVIRGRHAAAFAGDLLQEIKACSSSGTAAFGDAILATRRKLLAKGNPFVLTLTAYGDAEWLI